MEPYSPLLQLPEELILEITKYLSGKTLKAFSHTIKCFRRIAIPFRENERKFKGNCLLVWEHVLHEKEPAAYPHNRLHLDTSIERSSIDLKALQSYNALISACEDGDIEAVRILLHKASPNPPDFTIAGPAWVRPYLYTPIEAAARFNNIDIINLLAASGADLQRLKFEVKLRLIYSRYPVSLEAAEALIKGGLDIHHTSIFGQTMLHDICAMVKEKEMPPAADRIQLLLDHGLDINATDTSGECALRHAIKATFNEPSCDALDAVRVLLRSGPGVDVLCDTKTPLQIAGIWGHEKVVKMLLSEFGASLTAQPAGTLTALESLLLLPVILQMKPPPTLRVLLDAWIQDLGFHRPNILLYAAACLDDIPLLQQLLPLCKPDADTPVYGKEAALSKAVQIQNENAVEFLLPHVTTITIPATLKAAFDLSKETLQQVFLRASQAMVDEHAVVLIRHAALFSSPRVLSQLLEHIEVPLAEENTIMILEEAAGSGKAEAVKMLLNRLRESTTTSNASLDSAFARAVENGCVEVIKLLLGEVNLETPHGPGNTALGLAIHRDQYKALKVLVEAGADIDAPLWDSPFAPVTGPQGVFGRVPVSEPVVYAANMGRSETLAILLSAGADPSAVDEKTGRSILMLSCQLYRGRYDTVRSLIHEHKVDIHTLDKSGMTALSHAAMYGCPDTMKLLLDAGAKADMIDENGETPFFLVCATTPLLKRLRLAQGIMNSVIRISEGPIPQDTIDQSIRSARLLLDAGADRDHKDSKGRTAFSNLASTNLHWFVKWFLDVGVNVDEVDGRGRTALSWACEGGNVDTVKTLVEAGCDIFIPDQTGKTPLEYVDEDRDDILRLLYSEKVCNDL